MRVKIVPIENLTVILTIPKSQASNIRKEIRHRLDSPNHSYKSGRINYVFDRYDIQRIDRGDVLEVIATNINAVLAMSNSVEASLAKTRCKEILEESDDVDAVGKFRLGEQFYIEVNEEKQ